MRSGFRVVVVAMVTTFGVSACGGGGESGPPTTTIDFHFSDDFAPACRGNAVEGVAAYDPAVPGVHKTVFLEGTSPNDLSESFLDVPTEWTIQFSSDSDEYAKGELAVCILRSATTLVQECTGYQNDGVEIDAVVKLYSATYDVAVHKAATGEQLGSTQVVAEATDCPTFVSFNDGAKERDWFETDAGAIADFVTQFAQT